MLSFTITLAMEEGATGQEGARAAATLTFDGTISNYRFKSGSNAGSVDITLPTATASNNDTVSYSLTGGSVAGLSFNSSTRKLTGKPTTNGTNNLTYTATAGSLTASLSFTRHRRGQPSAH